MAFAVPVAVGGCAQSEHNSKDGAEQRCALRGPAVCIEGFEYSLETCTCVPEADAGVEMGAPASQAERAILNELAVFQSLSVGVDGGPCQSGAMCGESFVLGKDGVLVHVDRGRRFEAPLPADDLKFITDLASSEVAIMALMRRPGCPGAIHGTEQTEIQFAPGVFISGDISGCIDGPLAALRYRLHAVAKRLFPESGTQVPPAVPLPDVSVRYNLQGPVTLDGYSVRRRSEHCAPPSACAESTSVVVAEGIVWQLGGNPRGQFSGVTDFEPLSSFAVRADVIAELRKPAPCVEVTDLSETMYLDINRAMYLRAQTAGCTVGTIADLRAAARALVARLAGSPAADAGVADHPPDLSPP